MGSLRLYWTVAVLAVWLGLVGLTVHAPIRSLGRAGHPSRSLLQLPAIPVADAGITGSPASLEPSAVQAQAVQQLYLLLLVLAWAALVTAGISMLTRFTAQAAGRGPEIGVRRAAGASRRDLVLSLLGEGGMLLLVIFGVGLPVSAIILRLSVGTWPGGVPGAALLPWAAAAFLAAVVTFGALAPLRYAGSRSMRGGADGQVMLGVPAFQLALSLAILLASAALLRRAPERPAVATAPAAPAVLMALDSGTSSPEQRAGDIARLLDSLGHAPGVAAASLSSAGTMLGLGRVDDVTTDCGACVRGQIYVRYDLHTAAHYLVSPDTFAAQGIKLVSGRGFTEADRWGAQPVAVVSRHLAVSGFEARGAVGRDLFLGLDWPNRPVRVIGVVEDTPRAAIGGALEPLDTIYLSVLQHPPRAAELLVTASDAGMTDTSLAALVRARAGPRWTARLIGTPERVFAAAMRPVRWFGRWFTAVGLVVLICGLAGTFGTMRMWVESCTAEVAARRAVGATRLRILGWVLWHTAGVGVKGVLVGAFIYYSALRVSLVGLVGRMPGWDASLVAGLGGLLVGAAVLGAVLPTLGLLRRPIASLFS